MPLRLVGFLSAVKVCGCDVYENSDVMETKNLTVSIQLHIANRKRREDWEEFRMVQNLFVHERELHEIGEFFLGNDLRRQIAARHSEMSMNHSEALE